MGQKLSAPKKIREASEQAQCPSTLNEPTNELLSREDDYAVPSSNDAESIQFNSIDTLSEALSPIPELEAETAPITLPNLCSELILEIAEYLPPSSHVSLSYACRTMRSKMGVSFAQVLGDTDPKGGLSGSTLSIESRNVRYLERLELWSMLVRDGKVPLWKASYSGYRVGSIDDYWMVPRPLYVPLSTEHRYLGNAGFLWVCPHQRLNYHDATTQRATDNIHRCGSSYICSSRPLVIIWSIMRIPANSVPTSKEVVEALRPLNAPICPHLRLNDASVARIYDPKCEKVKDWEGPASGCRCSNCLSGKWLTVVCSYCDTALSFGIRPDPRGWATFHLLIMREPQFGLTCIDRRWIARIARPTDLEDYERAWEATNAECLRRLGSSFDGL